MNKIVSLISILIPLDNAFAHCDIPCGVYDPFVAQRAAHTVLRMTQLLNDIKREDETKTEHDVARLTRVKEKHSDLLEEELGTLQNDYFKKEHYDKHSNLNELFPKVYKSLTKARQFIDLQSAQESLDITMQIAEIFFKTKGVESVKLKSVYPTGKDFVLYK